MSVQPLEQAIASTRAVFVNVSADQLDASTPCAEWKVSDLINHIVGAQLFFTSNITGSTSQSGEVDFSAGDYVASYDDASRACVDAFSAEGIMDTVLSLPFGEMPGRAFVGIAATDTFTHGWDLAKATGQDTNLAPQLAEAILAQSRQFIQPSFRSEQGNPFGPEQSAPAGASVADQLAAFLGRKV